MDQDSRAIVAPPHLGLETRSEFRRAAIELLDALPEGGGVLVIDLSATRLLDSAGLGTLIQIRQHAAKRRQVVRLRGASEELRLLLVLTRLEDQFVIDERDGAPPGPAPVVPRVLFVEDEKALASAYGRFFVGRYTMAFATTGEQALAQVEAFGPDLMVLDMNLPDTDGVEVLRRVRTQRPELPVVVTTAYASMQPLLGVMGLAHSGFLMKPFELKELAKALEGALKVGGA